MNFLLYGINFSPELTGIGKYSGEMAQWLARNGHEVRVVTAPPYYPDWKMQSPYRNRFLIERHGRLHVYRCPLFVPKSPKTISRLVHLMSFALSSLLALFGLLRWRPDVVIMVEPTLFCAPGALLYARMTGAKTVLHIQDYEVDAMFGLGLMRRGFVARWADSVESWLMRRFDRISTISQSMMRHALEKRVQKERVLFFPNWVDTDFIRPDVDRMLFRRRWGIPESTRVVLYSGNMGRKQGLEMVVEAACRLRQDTSVMFFMVGQGAARDELEDMARSKGLVNMRFEPLQAYAELPCLLALADIHLVVQKKGAADVVLPSKLTGILAAGGHALITAEADTELGVLTAQNPGIALRVEPESLDDFCAGLGQLLARESCETNMLARNYALRFLNQEAVLKQFEADMQAMQV